MQVVYEVEPRKVSDAGYLLCLSPVLIEQRKVNAIHNTVFVQISDRVRAKPY